MGKLLEALASWEGPEQVGEMIAGRGLHVPRVYRDEMIAYCMDHDGSGADLEVYWAECSKEYVLSGGRSDSRRRRFLGEAPYRSAYLDRLAIERKDLQPSAVPELHPCLRHWIEEKKRSHETFGSALWDKIESVKEDECSRHGALGKTWTGRKKDVKPILKRYAEQRGFRETRLEILGSTAAGRVFCKETVSGLVFYCFVDTGGLPDVGGRLPIHFFVAHKHDSSLPLGAGPNSIYAGADYYATFRSAAGAEFGVFALVEIFDAFYSTFA